jgi:hypothetical protein
MSNIPSKIRFTDRDRDGALRYAIRMARDERVIYVLYYDYNEEVWSASKYTDFHDSILVPYEDKRFILPQGEVTRLS